MRRAPLLAAGLLLLSLLLLLVALRALSDQEQSVQPGPLKRGGLAAGVSETRPWLEKIAHDQRFERGEGRGRTCCWDYCVDPHHIFASKP